MKMNFPPLPRNAEVHREAIETLIAQMGIAKAAMFLGDTLWQPTDYLEIKDQQFADETVASLYEKVLLWRQQNSNT